MRNALKIFMAYFQLATAWFNLILFWLLVAPFMLMNAVVVVVEICTRPLEALSRFLFMEAIGVIVLWTITWAFNGSRIEVRQLLQDASSPRSPAK